MGMFAETGSNIMAFRSHSKKHLNSSNKLFTNTDNTKKTKQMLQTLTIENIVLVKYTILEFSTGLCVLTGETGAGKSIILNSILTLLGKETKAKSLVRQGCKYGSIEGTFTTIPEETERLLLENAITPTGSLRIKCILAEDGSSKNFINNQQVPQSVIKQIGETLIEVNRQHEQTYLMDEKNHIKILDEYAQNQNILNKLAEKYTQVQEIQREIEQTTLQNKQIALEIEWLKDTQTDLKSANINENEYESLQEKRIQNKKKHNIFQTLTSASQKLEGASIGQVLMNIHRMIAPLENNTQGENNSENTETLSKTIDRICIDIQEIEGVISSLIQKNYINTSEIDQDEERFFFLQDLSRKYKIQPFELPTFKNDIDRKIESFNKSEQSISHLNNQKKALENEYLAIAMELRQTRTLSAKNLSEKINSSLSALQMEGASFTVKMEECKMRKSGIDAISFMIETNKNMGFGKLSLTASGGEVSRIVLAIKSAIAHLKQIPCVIFDEIDTGISGKTSNAVGEVMLELAKTTQIIIITHQPQVAAKAKSHFKIEKTSNETETETKVAKLEGNGRVLEIARLLSGENITKEAISNAQIFINS